MIDTLKILHDQGIRTTSYISAASDALIKSMTAEEYISAVVDLVGENHCTSLILTEQKAKFFHAYAIQELVKAHLKNNLTEDTKAVAIINALALAEKKVNV